MSFKSVGSDISKKEHVPLKEAYAMLASSGRHASMAAKIKNHKLMKISGNKMK
jgi:hypothetical protein